MAAYEIVPVSVRALERKEVCGLTRPDATAYKDFARIQNPHGFKTNFAMSQMLLIPDPRPLDERFGKDFFKNVPKRTGVYLMRDEAGNLLYVGKAKTLRNRLQNYRIANPDRMPRRHLRLVRQVARIDFHFCRSEAAALARESNLLRALKPKFNRAGVWPAKPQFIVWRFHGQRLEFDVVETPESGWRRFGPLGGMASNLRTCVSQLLWLSLNLERSAAELPLGWLRGRFERTNSFDGIEHGLEAAISSFFWDGSDSLVCWLNERLSLRTHAFDRSIIDSSLECLTGFLSKEPKREPVTQLSLL